MMVRKAFLPSLWDRIKSNRNSLLTALGAGFLVGIACPPTGLYPLAWIGFATFSALFLNHPEWNPRQTAVHFGCLTWPMNMIYFYWFVPSLRDRTEFPWIVCLLIVLGLFAVFSTITGVFGYIYGRLHWFFPQSLQARAAFLWVFLIFWDTFEWRIFPYTPIQYALDEPVLFAATYFFRPLGLRVWLFGFSVALAFLYLQLFKKKRRAFALGALGVTVVIWGGYFFAGQTAMKHLKGNFSWEQPVVLIQDNFKSIKERFENARSFGPRSSREYIMQFMASFRKREQHYEGLIAEASANLEKLKNGRQIVQEGTPETWVFWAETAFQVFKPNEMGPPLLDKFKGEADLQLVGYNERVRLDGQPSKLFNSVALVHAEAGYVASFRKSILFPMGEYIPGEARFPILRHWFPKWGRYSAADKIQLLAHPDPQGPIFIPFICYEAIFSHHVEKMIALARQQFPGRPLVLVNPTSDFRFGKTSETIQHSMLTRWQVVLSGLPMVRPNGYGYTEIIAPWGEALQRTERDVPIAVAGWLPVEKVTIRKPAGNN